MAVGVIDVGSNSVRLLVATLRRGDLVPVREERARLGLGDDIERLGGISAAKLAAKVGRRVEVIVDRVDPDGAVCRTKGDAPEIDGNLFVDEGFGGLAPGDILTVEVDDASDDDLWGRRV